MIDEYECEGWCGWMDGEEEDNLSWMDCARQDVRNMDANDEMM